MLDIRVVEAPGAGVIADYQDFLVDCHAAQFPGEDPPGRETTEARLRPDPADAGNRVWFARRDGRLVGVTRVDLLSGENVGLARVKMSVRPDSVRRGIGTALLRTAAHHIRDSGYDRVMGGSLRDSPGDRFAAAHGFRVTASFVIQELDVRAGSWRESVAPPPDGFALAHWIGHAPEELVESFVEARFAFDDRPRQELSYEQPLWTVERVRTEERRLRELDVEQRVTVAIETATGAVAGLTVVELPAHEPERASQKETAVLSRYRGRGLGLCMKAGMLARLDVDRPGVRLIQTGTALSNEHMIAVNHRLGYTDRFTSLGLEQPLAELLRRL